VLHYSIFVSQNFVFTVSFPSDGSVCCIFTEALLQLVLSRLFVLSRPSCFILCAFAGPPVAYAGTFALAKPDGGINQNKHADRGPDKLGLFGTYELVEWRPLADLCSWQIGGPARYSVEVKDEETLLAVMR
jgi:hypothetical protein